MNDTTTIDNFSSPSCPCLPDEVTESVESVEEWLEDEALAGFRVWQLAGIILSIILAITVAFCCCIRFRIPRTKQNIEADYIRKRITKNFRKELAKISNTDMDEMDLRRALERVRADLDAESEELEKQQGEIFNDNSTDGLRARLNAMVHGMRVRFSNNSTVPSNPGIQEFTDNGV